MTLTSETAGIDTDPAREENIMSAPSLPQPVRHLVGQPPSVTTASIRDAGGYALYAEGDLGAIHVFAHRMLDEGRIRLGHRVLGRWLAHRSGRGHHWVHVQWHMAIFDLELNRWQEALARFQRHVQPYAFATDDALTDAPSLLWRLRLAAPSWIDLPWHEAYETARRCMRRTRDPYVQLHNLLALAGVGDLASLDRWLVDAPSLDGNHAGSLLWSMAQGLRAYAAGAYAQAALHFGEAVPRIALIGGSRAQNSLFERLHESAIEHAEATLQFHNDRLAA